MIITDKSDIYLGSDIDFVHAKECRNKEKIRKWCRQFTLISDDEQDGWRSRILNPDIKMFSVRYCHEQVGVAGFTSIDRQNRSAEFSLWIDPSFHSRGFGKQALFLLLRHGFKDWGFNRIWGEVFDGNPAMKLFEKIGFKMCGNWPESYFRDGKFIDSHLINLLARDFEDNIDIWL